MVDSDAVLLVAAIDLDLVNDAANGNPDIQWRVDLVHRNDD